MSPPRKPSADELTAAQDGRIADLIRPGLKALLVGINPSLYSAAVGHHFARPGNRFWPAIHRAGITPRRLDPSEGEELLRLGYGITNVVARATATADALAPDEMIAGGRALVRKVRRYQPAVVAFLGLGAYRTAFNRREAKVGPQADRIGEAIVWALPNPSGLNAHYRLEDLAEWFASLRQAVDGPDRPLP